MSNALNSVGKAAFTALPVGVIENISGHKTDGTPIEKNQGLRVGEILPSVGPDRRASAAGMYWTDLDAEH